MVFMVDGGYDRERDVVYAHNENDIPEHEHFAIIEFSSIYVPGDERSITNPGHGYPGGTEQTINYIVFRTRELWEQSIVQRTLSKSSKPFVPVVARKAKVEVVTKIDVDGELL